MESGKIEKLLEKYFEAETTLEEEKLLRNYFISEDVASHLEHYKTLFSAFSTSNKEEFVVQFELKPQNQLNYKWLGTAAAILVLVGLYLGNSYREQKQAEYAYRHTLMALDLIARNLDRGTVKVARMHTFEETKQKIYRIP